MQRNKAFTLWELLVLVAVVVMSLCVLLPGLIGCSRSARERPAPEGTASRPSASRPSAAERSALERMRQAQCKMNLNMIGRGMMQYERNESMRTGGKGAMPRFWANGDPKTPLPTKPSQTVDELWKDTDGDNILDTPNLPNHQASMQQVWLLMGEKLATENMFGCPSDEAYVKRSGNTGRYGWTSASQVSYGLHWYSAANGSRYPLETSLDDDWIIMADQHPSSTPVYKATGAGSAGAMVGVAPPDSNSGFGGVSPSNHRADGFNVLTLNGRVRWHGPKNKDGYPLNSYAGKEKDDVYTMNGAVPQPAVTTDPAKGKSKFVDTYIVPNVEE